MAGTCSPRHRSLATKEQLKGTVILASLLQMGSTVMQLSSSESLILFHSVWLSLSEAAPKTTPHANLSKLSLQSRVEVLPSLRLPPLLPHLLFSSLPQGTLCPFWCNLHTWVLGLLQFSLSHTVYLGPYRTQGTVRQNGKRGWESGYPKIQRQKECGNIDVHVLFKGVYCLIHPHDDPQR